jgi:hypothetical protein
MRITKRNNLKQRIKSKNLGICLSQIDMSVWQRLQWEICLQVMRRVVRPFRNSIYNQVIHRYVNQ